jgi:hypothetical protein
MDARRLGDQSGRGRRSDFGLGSGRSSAGVRRRHHRSKTTVPKRPASLRVARVSGRSRTRALSCRSARAPAPPTNANPTSTYARSRRPNTLEGHAETGVADDASIDSARLPRAVVSTFQVCRLCTNPLPHEYDVPLVTVADTGQNPITAATTTTSPAMRSTTCCGPDNWRTTLPGESRVAPRMDTRGQPSVKPRRRVRRHRERRSSRSRCSGRRRQTSASRNATTVSAVAFLAASKMLSSP